MASNSVHQLGLDITTPSWLASALASSNDGKPGSVSTKKPFSTKPNSEVRSFEMLFLEKKLSTPAWSHSGSSASRNAAGQRHQSAARLGNGRPGERLGRVRVVSGRCYPWLPRQPQRPPACWPQFPAQPGLAAADPCSSCRTTISSFPGRWISTPWGIPWPR